MIIAGREKEVDELNQVFDSDQAEFVTLYGRRRVGKTFLIEQLFGSKDCHFFHVTGIKGASAKIQLKEFSRQIGDTFFGGIAIAEQPNWLDAMYELDKALSISSNKDKKTVLFLDELPWLCTPKSGLLEALEYYWNRYWKNNARVKLVVCGSSASWMIRKIVNNKGGLHNRQTLSILLKPLNLCEVKAFLHKKNITLNHQQLVSIYMAIGGVPYYLSFIKKGMSAAQVIDKLCFQSGGLLFNEFDKLFDALFDNAEMYKSIIRTIANKREGISLTAIGTALNQSSKSGSLLRKLQELEDAAFIKAFIPIGHKKKMKFYRVIDEYCFFYLKWIEGAKESMLADLNTLSYWESLLHTPEYYSWRGYAFESVCYKHLSQISRALNLGRILALGPWRYTPRKNNSRAEKGVQIDLIFDRADDVMTIVEIKYTDKPFVWTHEVHKNMLDKITVFNKMTHNSKQISIALISANGLKNPHVDIDSVVVLEDLFKY